MINVGIVGCGYIGGALKDWLEKNNKNVSIFISDPIKGYNDDLSNVDIIFISIHIPTENDGSQDLTILKQIIKNLPNKPIFIRTTVLPGTCDSLSREFGKKIYFMPEFLTQRTAIKDFSNQSMIFTGEQELLEKIFIGKNHISMTSLEAEIAKYAHNSFGAVKVTYFNAIYDLCKRLGCEYKNVQQGVLLSGYINDTHTYVPGPDGKLGYGGKCFPKDIKAFAAKMKNYPIAQILTGISKLNEKFRG